MFSDESIKKSASQKVDISSSIVPIEIRYQTQKEMLFAAMGRQFEYGKWVLASLMTVHAGSLFAISQAGTAKVQLYRACGPLLIYGVATTLIAGGLAWANFSFAAIVYSGFLRDIREGREPALTGGKRIAAMITFLMTPFVAIGSLVLFLVAAARAVNVL
jgi:hypothetical protein